MENKMAKITCPSCGTLVDKDDILCPICGEILPDEIDSSLSSSDDSLDDLVNFKNEFDDAYAGLDDINLDEFSLENDSINGLEHVDDFIRNGQLNDAIKLCNEKLEEDHYEYQDRIADYYFKIGDYKTALKNYHVAATYGVGRAQIHVGLCYQDGKGINKDISLADNWIFKGYSTIKKAADNNDVRAIYDLAWCYQEGYVVDKDIKKALQLYENAANLNLIDAMLALARHFEEKTYYNQKASFSWYEKAANSGSVMAQLKLVEIYKTNKDYDSALYWLRLASSSGDKEANKILKESIDKYGKFIVPSEPSKPVKEETKAVPKNDKTPQELVKEYLEKADKLYNSKDYEDAFVYYEFALKIDPNCSESAMSNLVDCYLYLDIQPLMMDLLKTLAKKGCVRAIEVLLSDYDDELSYSEMHELIVEGVKKASPICLRFAGLGYTEGTYNFPIDLEKGEFYLLAAGKKDDAIALHQLAQNYEHGVYGSKDIELAIQCNLEAAKLGYYWAQYSVSLYYEYGEGSIKMDLSKAKYWWELYEDGKEKERTFKRETLFKRVY